MCLRRAMQPMEYQEAHGSYHYDRAEIRRFIAEKGNVSLQQHFKGTFPDLAENAASNIYLHIAHRSVCNSDQES